MSSLSTILIVGASRGIGLEFVRQAAAQYHNAKIYATARDPTKAIELQKLAASNSRITILTVDATSGTSLKAVAETIAAASGSLDRVIYNAGVLSGWGSLLDAGIDSFKANMDTNVYGAYYTALYFVPLLLKSKYPQKSLILLSSSFASLNLADEIFQSHVVLFGTTDHDPTALYNISKTALNRLGKELDQVFRPQGLPIVLLHPGLVRTDMNASATIEVEESVEGMMKVIESGNQVLFIDYTGKELPW